MKPHTHKLLSIFLFAFLLSNSLFAQKWAKNKPTVSDGEYFHSMYRAKYSESTGLYRAKKTRSSIIISLAGNRFFGDVSSTDVVADFFSLPNMSYQGAVYYERFFSKHTAFRVGINGGQLSGQRDLTSENATTSGFKSYFAEPSITLNFHPWALQPWADGLYAFIGVGGIVNFIDEERSTATMDKTNPAGNICAVPIIPVGLGYRVHLNKDFTIGIEFALKQALIDQGILDIDNSYIPNPPSSEHYWPDGYYSLGVTAGYKF